MSEEVASVFGELFEQLTRKRAAERVAGYHAMGEYFKNESHVMQEIEGHLLTLQQCIVGSIRKGQAPEVAAAAHMFPLVLIHIGDTDESQGMLREFADVALPVVRDSGKPFKSRVALVTALGRARLLLTGHDEPEQVEWAALCVSLALAKGEKTVTAKPSAKTESKVAANSSKGKRGARGKVAKKSSAVPNASTGAASGGGDQEEGCPSLADLQEAGAHAWGLYASCVPYEEVADLCLPQLGELLAGGLLAHSAVEVRLAVGRAIALVYGAGPHVPNEGEEGSAWRAENKQFDEEDEEENDEEDDVDETFDPEAWEEEQFYKDNDFDGSALVDGSTGLVRRVMLVTEVGRMVTEHGHKRKKRDLRLQRQLFKRVEATLEDGYQPEQQVTLAGTHTCTGWSATVIMDEVRLMLASGFREQLCHNQFMQAVLEIDDTNLKSVYQNRVMRHEKEEMRKAKAKAVFTARGKERHDKANARNRVLDAHDF